MTTLDRRALLAAGAAMAASPAFAQAEAPVLTKPIPSSGEQLPVVGIGTAQIFNYQPGAPEEAERREVLQILQSGQVRLIDTAPSYGAAEDRLGELIQSLNMRPRFFLATKTRAGQSVEAHRAEIERSKQRLKTDKFDLMQFHNVSSANQDFGLLKELKAAGTIRYHGMSSTSDGAYAAFEQVMLREKPDFIQVDYAIDNRNVEQRILPAARDNGVAVLTALPFGRNRLFQRTAMVQLPELAREIGAATWAQFFLKYLIGHPAVNAVIPGTDKPQYMRDNLGAGRGTIPDEATRRRMAAFIDALPT